jgi:predicted nucleic acid-binding Zn ribbon protein
MSDFDIANIRVVPGSLRVSVTFEARTRDEFLALVDQLTEWEAPAAAPGVHPAPTGRVRLPAAPAPPVTPEPPVQRVCETCGKPIEGPKNKKFCNAKCRQKAKRERAAADAKIKAAAGEPTKEDGTRIVSSEGGATDPGSPTAGANGEKQAAAAPDDLAILPNGTKAICAAAKNAARGGATELWELVGIVQTAADLSPNQMACLRDDIGDAPLIDRLQNHAGVVELVAKALTYPRREQTGDILEADLDIEAQAGAPTAAPAAEREVSSVGKGRHGGFGFEVVNDGTRPDV